MQRYFLVNILYITKNDLNLKISSDIINKY